MSLESTVGLARPNTKSLRATIPEGIVAFLELTERDKLEWKMDIVNGERVTTVRKVRIQKGGAKDGAPRRIQRKGTQS